MRRRCLLPLLLVAGCGPAQPPVIGVMVSGQPSQAAHIAAADLAPGSPPAFEAWVRRAPDPVAADTALQVAEQFASNDRVLAVVGHSNSAASLAASQVYNRSGLVQIAPTSTATSYGAAGEYSFRMVPGDDRQAGFIVDSALLDWPPAQRIAIVYVNDDYGRSFYRELRPRLGGVVFEGLYAEAADTVPLLEVGTQIAAAQPDLLIWLGRPRGLRVLLQPMRAEVPGIRVICGDACDVQSVYANDGGAFDGLRFVRFTDAAARGAALDAFRRSYHAATGEYPASEAILIYDAVSVVAAAFRDGARSREDVREYLMSLGRARPALQGLAGPIAFDDHGSLLRSYLLADVTEAGVTAMSRRAR